MATNTTVTQKIHSFEVLKQALKETPENLKAMLKTDVDWMADVKAQMPYRLKNAAKLVRVILDNREKLRKAKAEGLDATLKNEDYVEKFVGVKPSKKIFALAIATRLVTEPIFDGREIWLLNALVKLSQRAGDATLKNALTLAKKALETDSKEARETFQDIISRVVEKEDGSWTFVSADQAKTMAEQKLRAETVSTARLLSPTQLLANAYANILNMETVDPKTAADIETHALMILEKIKARPATKADAKELQQSMQGHVTA